MSKSLYDATQWNAKKIRLSILIPTRDFVNTHFAYSLAQLVKLTVESGLDVFVFMDSNTILLNQREKLVERANEVNSDYVLWLDSDMIFPPTTALRLLEHGKDIVACNYMKRTKPFTTVAYRDISDWNSWVPLKIYNELVEVQGVGMGCMLMKLNLFEKLGKPYFEFTYSRENKDWQGEDFKLEQKLRELGYKILIDSVLSTEIKHIGVYAFGNNT